MRHLCQGALALGLVFGGVGAAALPAAAAATCNLGAIGGPDQEVASGTVVLRGGHYYVCRDGNWITL